MTEAAGSLPISEEFGIGLFDLALFPSGRGVSVDTFAWDEQHFPKSWKRMTQSALREHLARARSLPSWKRSLKRLLAQGGKFYAKRITPAQVQRRLARGEQMIMYLDSSILYSERVDEVMGHYVAIVRYGSKSITLMDPHWKHGGMRRHPTELVLQAFYSVGGYCLFLGSAVTQHSHLGAIQKRASQRA